MRLLRLTDSGTGRTADGGSNRSSDNGAGDCASGRALFNGVAASRQGKRGNCNDGGGEEAVHGSSSGMVKLNACAPAGFLD